MDDLDSLPSKWEAEGYAEGLRDGAARGTAEGREMAREAATALGTELGRTAAAICQRLSSDTLDPDVRVKLQRLLRQVLEFKLCNIEDAERPFTLPRIRAAAAALGIRFVGDTQDTKSLLEF